MSEGAAFKSDKANKKSSIVAVVSCYGTFYIASGVSEPPFGDLIIKIIG